MNTDNLIIGAGGGKGGGSARAAVEAKNTLRSRQFARIVDLICEGEVEGLVGSNISAEATEKSIYFDGVPLRNETGQPNFDINAFSWAFVPGTQNQPVIPTGGTVATEVQVSQEVKYGNTGGGPVVRSIPEQYIDSCRVTVLVPRLTVQNTENGDINGGNIVFAIDVQNNGGGFVEVMRPTIEGKTNSEYQRSYEFDLPEPGPWDIRVRRITLDAETSNIQNQLYWSTFTKIVKQPLSYPNTALMGLKVDSALFNRVPSRAYKMRLLKVRVPSNYNPETRAYVGMWDGTFKTAWTDNPAWCWYDLATNTRYGLGEYLDSDNIDKWTLYQIAQYCDELVSDGRGGQEPRFTCNLYINTREEALKVLMNMASIFRGIVYWHSNTIFCSQDRPSNPVKLFTPANVIDGVFTYSGSAKQARHTVAYVSWNDPENLYKQTVEYVEDRESILRLGVRETEVTAMGCTSRSQANRLGRWILLTEREETDTVTFRTGLEGCGVMPGEIIQTTDPSRSGTRLGGRIVSATSTSIQLDGEVTLEPGRNYTIAVLLPSGTIEEKLVNWVGSQDLVTSTLQLNSQLAEIPQKNAIWILQADNLVAELWRVVSAVEASPGVIELTAVEHIPGKYAAIEQNLKLEPRPTSQINIRPSAVTNLVATTDVKKLNSLQYTTRIFVSWTPPKEGAARYIVTWRRGTDNDKTSITNDPAFDIDDVPAGTFEISVVAENAIGLRGPATTITHVVSESDVEADVQNLRLDPNFLGKDCPITWDRLDWAVKYTVQVYNNSILLREVPVLENKYVYTYTQNIADGGPYRNLEFKVKAHSWRGTSANWATLAANNPAPATPVGVSLEAGPGQVSITADKPEDQDLAGMIVLMGETPQTVNQLIYKGRDNAFMKTNLQAGILVYFKVAFYDDFGDTGLNYSSIVSTKPLAFGGIKSVTGLPDSPADVAGDTAVFLDVPETTGQRGLWGWDGTTWKYTRDGDYLVANSVTAEKINALNLSSISANLGTITGGNLTLAADGFIKGGATNYSSGTGFWMGNDGGTYKLRAGTPGSSGFEWTGSAFNVRGPDGSITISSGVVDWGKISGAGKPADGATRNVFRGDWSGSSVAYSVGDIVLQNGNGWSCVAAHTSSGANQPPASGAGNTWWGAYTVKGGEGKAGLNFSDAKLLHTDPTFQSGPNGIQVYNNNGNGTVTITREAKQADSPFGDSAYNLRISNAGTASPYLGGFTFATPSRANAQFVVRIIAKLPVGYELSWHSNYIGAGAESKWLTSSVGTGRFEEYLYFVRCGSEGTFSTTNYFALNGPTYGTPEAPINWYLAYATVYDFTALGLFVDVVAATASANAANAALADIAADNKLTAVEKQSAANEWGIINRERASIRTQADALGIPQELWDYDYVYAVLNDYITPLLQDISSTSVIDGATFRDKWSYFYEYRQRLINKMAAVAATKADWASVTGSGKPESGATVGANSTNLKVGVGVNMVFNGDYTDGLAGTTVGWRSAGNQHVLSRNLSNYTVQGEGTAYIHQPGWNGTAVFDANIWNGQEGQYFAVTPGQRYEVYAYLNTHRCVGRVFVHFLDAAGNQITDGVGSEVGYAGSINTISDMVLSHGFVVAPWNAAKALVIVRGYGIDSYDPYVFFSRVYFGMAHAGQTEASPWSPGRGISQITSSNVTTYIENAAIGAAQIGSIDLVGTSNFAVKSGTSGARMDMDSRRIKVFDASGVLRVQLGDLTV